MPKRVSKEDIDACRHGGKRIQKNCKGCPGEKRCQMSAGMAQAAAEWLRQRYDARNVINGPRGAKSNDTGKL